MIEVAPKLLALSAPVPFNCFRAAFNIQSGDSKILILGGGDISLQ